MSKPRLSIIVSTYNNPQQLSLTMEYLKESNFRDFEILVVNHCGEKVDFIKDKYFYLNITIMDMMQQVAKPIGINKALAYSLGEYIMIIDDNTSLPKDYIEDAFNYFEESDFVYPKSSNEKELVIDIIGSIYKKEIHRKVGFFSPSLDDKWGVKFFESVSQFYKVKPLSFSAV